MLPLIRSKHLERWLGGYARHVFHSMAAQALRDAPESRHLLFCLCDHFEPLFGRPEHAVGRARVRRWVSDYPELARCFRDADGRPPQHTFFFPGEEYHPEFFDDLEVLVRDGFGEIELHLHHEGSTERSLRRDIESYLELFAGRGHLPRSADGQPRYAFIHGNWALANGRPDGRMCGVDAELPLLFQTGCYADFTFPSVPDVSQPDIVNQIYWPTGDLARRRAYEHGRRARVGESFADRLLMIQGPLAVVLGRGRYGVRLEYGALTALNAPSAARIDTWVRQGIHVQGRPEWVFVKVYTHGAPEAQAASLLGDGGRALHAELARRYNDGRRWTLHYVTAREMYNLAKAAMAGKRGDPNLYRDFELPPPPIALKGSSRRADGPHAPRAARAPETVRT